MQSAMNWHSDQQIAGGTHRVVSDQPSEVAVHQRCSVLSCSEEIDGMSVKELRAFLGGQGVSTTGFLEKSEFVAAAKQVLQR